LIESNTMKNSFITPKLYPTPPPSSRREVMKKGLGLTLGTSALGLAGLGASSSAQAWSSWHTTSFINNADTQRGERNWAVWDSLADNSGIYGRTWTGVNVYWRNSKDAMWKDGFVRFYDSSGEIQAISFNFNHTNNPNGYKDILPTSMTMSNTKNGRDYYFTKRYGLAAAHEGWTRTEDYYINRVIGSFLNYYRSILIGGNPQYDIRTTLEGRSWAGACRAIVQVYKIRDDNGQLIAVNSPIKQFEVLIGYYGWEVWSLAIENNFDFLLFAPFYNWFLSALNFSKKIVLYASDANIFTASTGDGWAYYQTFTEPTVAYYAREGGFYSPCETDCNLIMAASGFLALAFGANTLGTITSLQGNRAAAIQIVPRALEGIRQIASAKNYRVYMDNCPIL
jgi:hypothetical protein